MLKDQAAINTDDTDIQLQQTKAARFFIIPVFGKKSHRIEDSEYQLTDARTIKRPVMESVQYKDLRALHNNLASLVGVDHKYIEDGRTIKCERKFNVDYAWYIEVVPKDALITKNVKKGKKTQTLTVINRKWKFHDNVWNVREYINRLVEHMPSNFLKKYDARFGQEALTDRRKWRVRLLIDFLCEVDTVHFTI